MYFLLSYWSERIWMYFILFNLVPSFSCIPLLIFAKVHIQTWYLSIKIRVRSVWGKQITSVETPVNDVTFFGTKKVSLLDQIQISVQKYMFSLNVPTPNRTKPQNPILGLLPKERPGPSYITCSFYILLKCSLYHRVAQCDIWIWRSIQKYYKYF